MSHSKKWFKLIVFCPIYLYLTSFCHLHSVPCVPMHYFIEVEFVFNWRISTLTVVIKYLLSIFRLEDKMLVHLIGRSFLILLASLLNSDHYLYVSHPTAQTFLIISRYQLDVLLSALFASGARRQLLLTWFVTWVGRLLVWLLAAVSLNILLH